MIENDEKNMPEEKLIPINIVNEMESAYIDYSMSVIVSRALPDVRDRSEERRVGKECER